MGGIDFMLGFVSGVPVWISTSEDVSAGWSAVLEREDHNMAAEFMVKDVQLIRAKVCRFYVPYII